MLPVPPGRRKAGKPLILMRPPKLEDSRRLLEYPAKAPLTPMVKPAG